MNKPLRARRLAIEPMENRLLLSGTQLDDSVFNLDSFGGSDYAVIAANQNIGITASFVDPGSFVGRANDSTVVLDTFAYSGVWSMGQVSADTSNALGQPQTNVFILIPDTSDTLPPAPVTQNLWPKGTDTQVSGRLGLTIGDFYDTSGHSTPVDVQPYDAGPDLDHGGPISVGGGPLGGFDDVTSSTHPEVILSGPTGPGSVTSPQSAPPVSPPISSEGGMIAVSEVLASLQRESATLGGADARLAAHRRAGGNALEAAAGTTVDANRLSGELARAVSFEVMDGQAADGTDRAKVDDGLSANGELSVEAGEKLSITSAGDSMTVAADDAAATAATNSVRHAAAREGDHVVSVHDDSLPVQLASYVTSHGTAANGRETNDSSATDSGHALVDAAVIPVANVAGDARGEVFSRWARSDSLVGRRDEDRHGLPWDMAPVLIVLGLERYLATKRHSDQDDEASQRSTRRESLAR